jgi:hypothetical protein
MAAKKVATPKKSTASISISSPNKAEMRKWEIESAMNTLRRAEEIRSNPKMMTDVKKFAQEQIKMLGNVAKGK